MIPKSGATCQRRALTDEEKKVCTRVWSIRFDRGEDWAVRQLDAISWNVDLDQAKLDAQASTQGQEKVAKFAQEFGRSEKEVWDLLEQNGWSFDAIRTSLTPPPKKDQDNKEDTQKLADCPLSDSSALKIKSIAFWVPERILKLKSRRS